MKHVIVGKLRGVDTTRKYGTAASYGSALTLEVEKSTHVVYVPEEAAEGLRIGQTIQVTIETLPSEGWDG